MIGNPQIQAQWEDLTYLAEAARAERVAGREPDPATIPNRFILEGNPGTGKSTFAAALAEMLSASGLTKKNEVATATGQQLTGDAVGVSAGKTEKFLRENKGKTIVIDEAQQIATTQYGREITNALTAYALENPDTAIILAGYGKGAGSDKTIGDVIALDPGLERRFPKQVKMNNPNESDRVQILDSMAQGYDLKLSPAQKKAVVADDRSINWSQVNAGGVENLLADAKQRAAIRAAKQGNPAGSRTLMPEDFGIGNSSVVA